MFGNSLFPTAHAEQIPAGVRTTKRLARAREMTAALLALVVGKCAFHASFDHIFPRSIRIKSDKSQLIVRWQLPHRERMLISY